MSLTAYKKKRHFRKRPEPEGGKEDNSWLLIKHKDDYSTEKTYDSEDLVPERVKNNKKTVKTKGSGLIKPMFARLTDKPFSREGWLFENKWDGYRAVADVKNGKVNLYSRNGQPFNEDYEPVARALEKSSHDLVLDGEIVVLNSRKKFGALILGIHEKDRFKYIGRTGGGFNQASLEDVYNKMLPFIREECPFEKAPKTNAPVTWLKPALICEVKFAEWTTGGQTRQPIFIALRTDKSPDMIVHEKPVKPGKTPGKKTSGRKNSGVNVPLTNPGKLYWPKEKISKEDLVNYYREMSGYILPYLKDRPESLHRHPEGITKPGFYQKDFDLKNAPEWIKTVPILSESNNKEIDYLICNNQSTLLYMANLGCIEINPWLSRHPKTDRPDYMAIDLDPEKIPFSAVTETALAVKEVLDELQLTGFCKTSGATGVHIYIPLQRRYDYEVSRMAAKFIAQKTHEKLPKITSLARSPSSRQRKVYVDYLQNSRGQTLAAPYSVRPRPKATVSSPLEWAELNNKLDPSNFTMHTIIDRVKAKGDLWKDLLKTKNSLKYL